MTSDPWDTLVDQVADRIIDRATPALVEAVEARRLPALAVTIPDAAQALGIHPTTVRRLIERGHLDVLDDVGTALRVTVASLHAYAGHPLTPQLHEVVS